MVSIENNDTSYFVLFFDGRKHRVSKWEFKKRSVQVEVSRLVAKGYSRVQRIDFHDIFLGYKLTFIIFVLLVARNFNLEIRLEG